jgi:hypothetical protein
LNDGALRHIHEFVGRSLQASCEGKSQALSAKNLQLAMTAEEEIKALWKIIGWWPSWADLPAI